MKSLFDGSVPNKRKKIFALDGSDRDSRVFSFRCNRGKMSQFEFNPEERNFPIFGAEYRNIPTSAPINYRLWIVELIYVYSIGKEIIMDKYEEQKVFPHLHLVFDVLQDLVFQLEVPANLLVVQELPSFLCQEDL